MEDEVLEGEKPRMGRDVSICLRSGAVQRHQVPGTCVRRSGPRSAEYPVHAMAEQRAQTPTEHHGLAEHIAATMTMSTVSDPPWAHCHTHTYAPLAAPYSTLIHTCIDGPCSQEQWWRHCQAQ